MFSAGSASSAFIVRRRDSHRDSSRSITQDASALPQVERRRHGVPAGDAVPGDERPGDLAARGRGVAVDRNTRVGDLDGVAAVVRKVLVKAAQLRRAERRQHLPDGSDVAAAIRVGVAPQRVVDRGEIARAAVARDLGGRRRATAPALPEEAAAAACRPRPGRRLAAPARADARAAAAGVSIFATGGSGAERRRRWRRRTLRRHPRGPVVQLSRRPERPNRLRAIARSIERFGFTLACPPVSKLERTTLRSLRGATRSRVPGRRAAVRRASTRRPGR